MKNVVIFFLSLAILSCTSTKNENEVSLFNNLVFKLKQGEVIQKATLEVKDRYTNYFNSSSIQVPLFKYIKHKDYEIFIGIPYNTSIEVMIENQLNRQDSLIQNSTLQRDSSYFLSTYNIAQSHIIEYAVKSENNSFIYLAAIADSRAINESINLSNRIERNE